MLETIDIEALKFHLQEVYHTHDLSGYDYHYTPGFEKCIDEIQTFFHLEGFVDFICGHVHQHHMDYFLQRETMGVLRTPKMVWYTYALTGEDKERFPEFRFFNAITFTQDVPELPKEVDGEFEWYEEK